MPICVSAMCAIRSGLRIYACPSGSRSARGLERSLCSYAGESQKDFPRGDPPAFGSRRGGQPPAIATGLPHGQQPERSAIDAEDLLVAAGAGEDDGAVVAADG